MENPDSDDESDSDDEIAFSDEDEDSYYYRREPEGNYQYDPDSEFPLEDCTIHDPFCEENLRDYFVPDYDEIYDSDPPSERVKSVFTLSEYIIPPPSVPIPVSEPIAVDSTPCDHWLAWMDKEFAYCSSDENEREYRPADNNPFLEAFDMVQQEIREAMVQQENPKLFHADRLVPKALALARMIRKGIWAHYDSDDSDDSDDFDDFEDPNYPDYHRKVVHLGDFLP